MTPTDDTTSIGKDVSHFLGITMRTTWTKTMGDTLQKAFHRIWGPYQTLVRLCRHWAAHATPVPCEMA